MFICRYCGKECKHKNSLAQHELRCKQNPNRKVYKSNFIKYNEDIKSGLVKKQFSNQYIKAKLLGLPKPEISQETREKLGNGWRGKKHTEEEKKKISASMKEAVRKYPDSYSASNVNGRVKKVEYNGEIYDSSWEVIFVKYLESTGYKWKRNKIGFEYFWENDIHLYYPDFYIEDLDLYIEVKGYKRDRDDYKWKSVNNLLVIKAKEINAIKRGTFSL